MDTTDNLDDPAFFSEALHFFSKRSRDSSPSSTCTGTVGRLFSNKKPRTMVNKLLQRNSNVAKGQDVHIGLSNYAYEPSTSLVSINALPPKFSAAYKFGHFNRMQSQCFALLYESDENVVVCAPTASGKTVLMEIAIYRLFNSPESAATKRAVYLAPLKSLCAEKATEWNANLRQAGLTCVDISGTDNIESVSVQQLCNASIICATPEKWISLTRKAPNRDVLSSLSLMLIDECHMVGSSRGAMLELAVLSTKRQNMQLRIIAVSATIKNLDDVAEWLSSGDISANGSLLKPAQTLVFGDEFRSTPLSKIVIGYESQYAYYRFQRNLDYKLPGIINAHCAGQSILVFCATRGSAQETCRFLMQKATQLTAPPTRIHLTATFTNKLLNDSVPLGIAFHHAGLSSEDRSRIEQLFLSQSIKILCSTSTLGVGVNLPAGAIIVKGTKGYFESGYEEHSSTDILQFIGRAGRPQFGASGKAIILTEQAQVSFYRNLVSGQETLESSLLSQLPRWIISGVCAHDFLDIQDIAKWLQVTFLGARLTKNLSYYGLAATKQADKLALCQDIVQMQVDRLLSAKLLGFNDRNLQATDIGSCVARYQVDPLAMAALLSNLPKAPTYKAVFEALCKCSEFNVLRISMGQKGMLNNMNKAPWLRLRLKSRVDSVEDKIFILIQYGLERKPPPSSKYSSGLANDISKALLTAYGPIMCIRDAYAQLQDSKGVTFATALSREIASRCREDGPAIFQQIDGIGQRYAETLWMRGIRSISDLCSTTTREIEHQLNRNPPFGTKILTSANSMPQAEATMDMHWIDNNSVVFTIRISYKSSNVGASLDSKKGSEAFTLIAYTSDDILLKYEVFNLSGTSVYYEVQIGLCNPRPNTLAILEVAPERYAGCSQKIQMPIVNACRHASAEERDLIIEQLLADDINFDSSDDELSIE